MAENLVYYNSRWRYLLLMLLSSGFVAMGVFILSRKGNDALGWMCIVFFGMGIVVGGRQLLDTRPRLLITDEGIFDRTLGVGTVRWADISGAYVQAVQREYFICLHLHNKAAYVEKLSPLKQRLTAANHALGFTSISINLSGVDLSPEQLLEYIIKQAAAAARTEPLN